MRAECGLITPKDIANGLANRFLFAMARRHRILPFGGELPGEEIKGLNKRLQQIVQHTENRKAGRITMNSAASALWVQVYASLSDHSQEGWQLTQLLALRRKWCALL